MDGYRNTAFGDLCEFVNEQFVFWTENEFAGLFRRMITIEQFRNSEMTKLYQDAIGLGPVRYTQDLLREMMNNGRLKEEAERIGTERLAVWLFAPLQLSIQLSDGGEDPDRLKENLRVLTKDFENRWMK